MKYKKIANHSRPSEIQRYRQDKWSQFGVVEDNNGDWVRYDDYLSVKLELDRIMASSFITAVPAEEYDKLKLELDELKRTQSNRISKNK